MFWPFVGWRRRLWKWLRRGGGGGGDGGSGGMAMVQHSYRPDVMHTYSMMVGGGSAGGCGHGGRDGEREHERA